jgi:hypothetical protein
MPSFEEIQEQIKNKEGVHKYLNKREFKELPNILWEDEIIERVISGTYQSGTGLLLATNKRLIFIDKGLVKLRVEDFPFDKISSIQYATGIVLGKITVFTSGNRAEISNLTKSETRPFAEYARARITGKTDHASAPQNITSEKPEHPTAPAAEDRIKQLERLAYLKHKGMLTEEEFTQEKRRLLSS